MCLTSACDPSTFPLRRASCHPWGCWLLPGGQLPAARGSSCVQPPQPAEANSLPFVSHQALVSCPSCCLFDLLFVFGSRSYPVAQPPAPRRPGCHASPGASPFIPGLGCSFGGQNLRGGHCKMVVLWSELAINHLVLSRTSCSFRARKLSSSR